MRTAQEPWIDWVAVERAVNGEPVGRALTRWERAHAITTLLRAGLQPSAVAARLRISHTTVRYHRDRAAGGSA